MKILWITNLLFPEAMSRMTGNCELKTTGGWMLGLSDILVEQSGVCLSVATVSNLVKSLTRIKGKNITYYVIPLGKGNIVYNKTYELYWKQIKKEVQPDVVHIHGTEFTHGLAYVNACGNEKIVVSIQGLKYGIAPYYCAGLTWKEIYRNITFHDIFKGGIYKEQRRFYQTAKLEIDILRKVNHIIGRTSWDMAYVRAINPNATYHCCNEILRKEFYDNDYWEYEKCTKHSIFLSQAGYPVKGLHQVINALPFVQHYYPDTTIRIAGRDITYNKGLWGILHFTGYGKIIKDLIRKYHMEHKIIFLGHLNAKQMKQEYLHCNLFICPSSIENSPNSLGEAQILGVPCIASYVGGIPDMMQNNENGLYRFEEIEMLANKICSVFDNVDMDMIGAMRVQAKERHNANNNVLQLLSIYNHL